MNKYYIGKLQEIKSKIEGDLDYLAIKIIDNLIKELDQRLIITWSVEDVYHIRYDLTFEQAKKVLENAGRKHDSEIGINWGILEYWANELYPKNNNDFVICPECGEDVFKLNIYNLNDENYCKTCFDELKEVNNEKF